MDVDLAVLRARYGELTPLDAAPDSARFGGALPDGTPVVVSALHGRVRAAVGDEEAFLHHMQRVASLRHEEINRLVSWGRDDGVLHCGYVRREAREVDPGAYSSVTVADMGARLARALHAAHRSGMTHGAIATQRVHVTADGAPRLLEFGLVPALIAGGMSPAAAYEELCDVQYLSPEQQAGEAPTPLCDVYSLGATLYELLTGKAPFGGRTTSYVMATVLPEEPTSGADKRTTADVVIHALLRAIELRPQDRWPTARALADALDAVSAPTPADSGRRATAGHRGLRARFAAILSGAWFRPDGRGSDLEESPGSTGQTAR